MGTRADFYIGIGEKTKWLGSIGWDGDQWSEKNHEILYSKNKEEFLKYFEEIKNLKKFIHPAEGWPWAWEDSSGTNYSYHFNDIENCVEIYYFGKIYRGKKLTDNFKKEDVFPNMKYLQNSIHNIKSGFIIMS